MESEGEERSNFHYVLIWEVPLTTIHKIKRYIPDFGDQDLIRFVKTTSREFVPQMLEYEIEKNKQPKYLNRSSKKHIQKNELPPQHIFKNIVKIKVKIIYGLLKPVKSMFWRSWFDSRRLHT